MRPEPFICQRVLVKELMQSKLAECPVKGDLPPGQPEFSAFHPGGDAVLNIAVKRKIVKKEFMFRCFGKPGAVVRDLDIDFSAGRADPVQFLHDGDQGVEMFENVMADDLLKLIIVERGRDGG